MVFSFVRSIASSIQRIFSEKTEPTRMNTTSLGNQTIPPNQALQTTTRTVTPAASHPSRQRVSCLI
jgi:hypothetical protein